MKKIKHKKTYYAILVFISCVLIFFLVLLNYAASSIDKRNIAVDVNIPTGSSFLKVTEILHRAGLVKSRFLFYSLAFTRQATRSIRAGEYEFNTSMSPATVMDKLLRGEIKTYRITIPEDFTVKEIANRLAEYKLIDEVEFINLSTDESFIDSLGIKGDSVEGYLFPETYLFDRSMSTRQIMKIMVGQFWKKVTPEMQKRANDLGFNMQQFVTLASIIGKESGNSEEKPLISAVFHNRLRKKMKLQSDPTAVYDLENFDGRVRRHHLKRNSPYNTYVISGLPPGPITNPGIDSLNAALSPAKVNYLYFVSKHDGTHYFSATLDMHNRAINHYRQNRPSKNK